MKSIVKIPQRLMSLFLIVIASSIIFLPSPAIADTSSLVNFDYKLENDTQAVMEELFNRTQPIIMILAPDIFPGNYEKKKKYLEKTKIQAEKFYGNNYKILIGLTAENKRILLVDNITDLKVLPVIIGYSSHQQAQVFIDPPFEEDTQIIKAFELVKKQLN